MRYPTDAATRSLAVLIFFTAFSGHFWRNLIGVWGFLALVAAITVVVIVIMTRRRLWARLDLRRLPRTLLLFAAIAVVSIAWSSAPGGTALAIVAQSAATACALLLTVALSWPRLIAALSTALCWVLGLSLVFELVAAVFVRAPVPAFWSGAGGTGETVWTRSALFSGGPVQGIVGDSDVLAFVAVLALIVLGVQLAQRLRRRVPTVIWLVLAVLLLALTRSGSSLTALVVSAVMLGAVVLARRVGPGRRVVVQAAVAVATALAIAATAALYPQQLVGSSPPLRTIWAELWSQPGAVGLILFALLVVGTWHRVWWFAVDHPLDSLGLPIRRVPLTLAPVLVLSATIAVSLVDSRLPVEAGWVLLVVFAVKSKLDQSEVALDLANGDEPENPLPARSFRAHRVKPLPGRTLQSGHPAARR